MFDFVDERRATTKTHVFPAPTKGWIQAGNITQPMPDAAERLDNIFPTAQGAEVRGGSLKQATVGSGVIRLAGYVDGDTQKLFAATQTEIVDVTSPADADVAETADVNGLASGDWSEVAFTTSGGTFTVMANGTDRMHYHDGTDWHPIVDQAVSDLTYDALSAAFSVGLTVTGGTSGATATILSITPTSATAGVLKVGTITGTFQDNEALTDSSTGSATSNIPSGTSAASTVTVTGLATTEITQLWNFKERMFGVQKNSRSAWYWPAESIGGAITEIPLGSVFQKGGNLLFGGTWSLDSGAGIDDVCVFATDAGELAVYEGTDPASTSTWSLVGVYNIGKPLNKHASFKAGGDLAILTEDGIVPVSEALRKDRAALQESAITAPIEDAWTAVISKRDGVYPFTATLWQSRGKLLVGTPQNEDGVPISFVANAQTGAWCRYTGWDVQCSRELGNNLYFGTSDGKIYNAEQRGNDDGVAYTGVYVPKFTDMRSASEKIVNRSNLTARSSTAFNFSIKGLSDYVVPSLTPPASASVSVGDSAWGTGVWGTFVWGGSDAVNQQTNTWKTTRAKGFAVSHAIQITVNQVPVPEIEITSSRIRYENATPL